MTDGLATIFTEVGLNHYLTLATLLFVIGMYGVMTSRSVIRVLICVELMLNAVNINFVAFNNANLPVTHAMNNLPMSMDLSGQAFAVFILVVSAAEAAVGLAIVISLYRQRATVDMNDFNLLRG